MPAPRSQRESPARTSDLFGSMAGGRVLDVGTGKGPFVQVLVDELASYTEIIGLDISDAGATAFADTFRSRPSVRFVRGDAVAMPFADESFDTVAIVGSLHHVEDPERVLAEMRRVLRPGGAFIVGEQIRDHLTEAETTHRLFHEWSEEIMRVAFRPTYRRAEIIDLLRLADLEGTLGITEHDDGDPMDETKIVRWDKLIADFVGRTAREDLASRGQAIRARLHEVGIVTSPALFALRTKAS